MKKIFAVFVLTGIGIPVLAQVYIRANIGYNLPMGSQVIGVDNKGVYNSQQEDYSETSENVYGSYGSGFSFHAAIGGPVSGLFGYDVEAGYLLGKKYSVKETFYQSDDYNQSFETESYSRSFQIAPSFTFTASAGNIQPYTRMGPIIAITKLRYNLINTETYSSDGYSWESEYTLKGGLSFGFKGVLGINFNAKNKVQFFTELSFVSMSYSPKEGEITTYTVDGENRIDDIPAEDRKFKFKDKIEDDNGEDNIELREKYAMGSIALQAGVRYVLK